MTKARGAALCGPVAALLCLAIVDQSAGREPSPDVSAAVQVLHKAVPSAAWDAKTAVSADVTCDGRPDVVMVGREMHLVWIGVVPGGPAGRKPAPITLQFGLSTGDEDSFCAIPVRIETERLACAGDSGPLPGCRSIARCSAFSVVDQACDSFHFYWDSDHATLGWWRL